MKANPYLKSARIMRGWSQAKVAEAVGTDPVTVSRWERGLSFPYPYFREKLCLLFEKNAEELGLVQKPYSEKPLTRETALYDPLIPLPFTGAARLVGRDAITTQLRQRLCASESTREVALHGLPGVGKTSLATSLVYDSEVRTHFSDGILWVGLGPQPALPSLLSRWGVLLEIAPSEALPQRRLEAWAEALHAAIGTRRMLIVIDDAWTIEAALAFKVGGPYCSYIVTTRFPQVALQFAPDNPVIVRELSKDESLTLLAQWEPNVVMGEQQDIHALIQLVGGLPLALTLMGKYLREQTYTQQPRRMYAAMKLLHDASARLQLTEVRSTIERHPSLPHTTHLSLQSVIMVSDQRLSPQAQDALRVLSVFPPKPNTFSEEAACAACAVPVETFDVLVDAGLLESNGSGRYTLHQTIFDYAILHYQEQGARERLIAYFVNFVQMHERDYAIVELEITNILATLEMAYTLGKYVQFVRIVCSLATFWDVRASYAPAEEYLLRAYGVAKKNEDVHGQAYVLLHLGRIHEQWGNYSQVVFYLNQSLALAHYLSDDALIGILYSRLGDVAIEQGNYALAEEYYLEALPIARAVGDAVLQCWLLIGLGYLANMRGDYMQEEAYYQEGLVLARHIEDPDSINNLLINLGNLKREQGSYKQAEAYLHEGLLLAQQIEYKTQIIFFLTNFGELEYEQGNYVNAEMYLQEGLALARHIGHREHSTRLLVSLGMIARDRGDFEYAETYLQEGLHVAHSIKHLECTSNALRNLGSVALLREEYEQAEIYLQEALLLARKIKYCGLIGAVLLNLGALAICQGMYQQAETYLQEGLILAQQARKIWLICSLLFYLGRLYLKEQRLDLASTMFNEMLITTPKENKDLTPKALYGLALVASARGNIRVARSLGTKSCKTLHDIGHYLARDIEQWLNTLPTI